MLTPVPLPDFRDSARALMHDLPRLRAAINESLLCLRVLRGEVKGWQDHPCVAMWRGAEAGLYLLREEYRAAYAEATDGVKWGKDVEPPAWRNDKILAGRVYADSAILPRWWGDEAVHSSHRAVLLGKWEEEGPQHRLARLGLWPQKPASRLPGGSWPYAWPLPCEACLGAGEIRAGLTILCPHCDGKGYTLRIGPRGER